MKADSLKALRHLHENWRWSLYVIIAIIFLSFFERQPDRFSPFWSEPNQRTFINGDGHGYYAYLPAFLLYQDLSFDFIDDVMGEGKEHSRTFDDFRRTSDSGIVNITYMGVSLLWIPFFILAHLIALLTDFEANGYSTPYQLSILFAAIVYLWIGLWAFGRLLQKYKIKPWIISLCLFLMVFATSTINYVIDEPSMTHVYSLMLFSVFLLYAKLFFDKFKISYLWVVMISLALIGLTRPTNALMILAVPAIAGSWGKLTEAFKWAFSNIGKVIIPVVVFFLILMFQPFLYYFQTGSFFVWSYQSGATFSFADPHIKEILFSYRRGLFLYTPVLLLALFGLPALFRYNKFVFTWVILLLALSTYVLASWWNWWFGGSFGNRAFIEFYPIYFFIMAFGLNYYKAPILRHFVIYTSIILVFFNILLFYQFRTYIQHWFMDKESYWKVFLHTSPPYSGILYETEKLEATLNNLTNKYPSKYSETTEGFEVPPIHQDMKWVKGIAHTGVYSISPLENEFSPPIYQTHITEQLHGKSVGILSQVFIYPENYSYKKPIYTVLEVFRQGQSVLRLEATPKFAKEWNRVNMINNSDFQFETNDYITIYVFNPYKYAMYIDDVNVSLWVN